MSDVWLKVCCETALDRFTARKDNQTHSTLGETPTPPSRWRMLFPPRVLAVAEYPVWLSNITIVSKCSTISTISHHFLLRMDWILRTMSSLTTKAFGVARSRGTNWCIYCHWRCLLNHVVCFMNPWNVRLAWCATCFSSVVVNLHQDICPLTLLVVPNLSRCVRSTAICNIVPYVEKLLTPVYQIRMIMYFSHTPSQGSLILF